MSWSQTAPVPPAGVEWEQEQTTQGQIQTLFHMHWTAKIVRLEGDQIAIYLKEWCTRGSASNASWFAPPDTFSAAVSVNTQAGTEEALTAGKQYATVEWYYTGSAGSGVPVTLTLNDGTSPAATISFTAPATLVQQAIWQKQSGEWVKIKTL